MAYADPQSVTVGGVTTPLPRTSSGPASGAFSSADGNLVLDVSHLYGKRNRRTIRLTQSKIVSDPLVPAQNRPVSASAYLVVNTPANGFTVAEAKALADGLLAYLTASTGAKVTQLLGGEN